jgi:UDP-N-acetylglucosamine 2-epimerase (non-hydrolysing)
VVLSDVGDKGRTNQIATAMQALELEFIRNRPAVAVVQGDRNSASAGAQAASYAGIPLVHIEAGLRSRDRALPEEINRLVIGALADVHCAVTAGNADNLIGEGVPSERVAVTGNTIVDSALASISSGPAASAPGNAQSCGVLATIHRPENTDARGSLLRVLRGLYGIEAPVTLIAHPRTRAAIERFGLLGELADIDLVEPLGHAAFLARARAARLVVSDSRGIQEECTVIGKPLMVIRRSTERPESIDAGFATLVTPEIDIAETANYLLAVPMLEQLLRDRPSPYGDGEAGKRIALICTKIADGRTTEDAVAGIGIPTRTL